MGKEQGNAYKRITAIVQFRVYYTTITLSANYSATFLHFLNHIYLTHSTGMICLTCFFGNFPQCTGAAKVAHRIAGCVL